MYSRICVSRIINPWNINAVTIVISGEILSNKHQIWTFIEHYWNMIFFSVNNCWLIKSNCTVTTEIKTNISKCNKQIKKFWNTSYLLTNKISMHWKFLKQKPIINSTCNKGLVKPIQQFIQQKCHDGWIVGSV